MGHGTNQRPSRTAGGPGSTPRGSRGPARTLVCAVENCRMVWRPDAAFRSTRPGFDSPWLPRSCSDAGLCRGELPHGLEAGRHFQKHEARVRLLVAPAVLLGRWFVPWRIAAWFGGRTPLSEARGPGTTPRGSRGLARTLVCVVENCRMVWRPDTAFRSTRPGFDSPWLPRSCSDAGLCRGQLPHGLEAGHRFQKHEARVRLPRGSRGLARTLVCAVDNCRMVWRPAH